MSNIFTFTTNYGADVSADLDDFDQAATVLFDALASSEGDILSATYALGVLVWNWTDAGTMTRDEAAARMVEVSPYAATRGVSAANLSKMVKLVTTWSSVDKMHTAIDRAGCAASFGAAYKLAVETTKSQGKAKSKSADKVSVSFTASHKDFDADAIAAAVGADLTDEERAAVAEALLAM